MCVCVCVHVHVCVNACVCKNVCAHADKSRRHFEGEGERVGGRLEEQNCVHVYERNITDRHIHRVDIIVCSCA